MAIQPVRWPAWQDWRDVLARTWREAGDDNVGFLASGVAFYAFLAFVPLLASVVLVYGLVADPPTVTEHVRKLFGVLPRDAAALIADQLRSLTETPDSAKGWGLVVALALAVYGASKGAGGIVTALNIAYEVRETRGFVKTTLLALAMTLGGLAVLLAGAGTVSIIAWIEAFFPGFPGWAHFLLQSVLAAAAVAAVALALAALYRWAPNRPDAPWVWVSPGSGAATLLWLLASGGFGLYVSHFGNYNATYGSLGGVVVLLTWLYLSAYILLMGGELNSELERQQAQEAQKAQAAQKAPAAPAVAAMAAATAAEASPPFPPAGQRAPRPSAAHAAGLVLAGFVLARWRGRRRKSHPKVGDRFQRRPLAPVDWQV
jgi:membrane protein